MWILCDHTKRQDIQLKEAVHTLKILLKQLGPCWIAVLQKLKCNTTISIHNMYRLLYRQLSLALIWLKCLVETLAKNLQF